MRLRYWILVIADSLLIFHMLLLFVIFGASSSDYSAWMFSIHFTNTVYISLSLLILPSLILVYYSVFRLNETAAVVWCIYMLFVVQYPIILVLILLANGKSQNEHIATTILLPGFIICFWFVAMIRMYTFYNQLDEFYKRPEFMRQSPVIMQMSVTKVTRQQNR